jgi:hypothetical protein
MKKDPRAPSDMKQFLIQDRVFAAGETITAKSQHIKHGDSTARKALNIETEKPVCAIQIRVLCQSPAKQGQDRIRSLVRPQIADS